MTDFATTPKSDIEADFVLTPGIIYDTRCGGKVTIARLINNPNSAYFATDAMGYSYLPNGQIYDDFESPNDIIAVADDAVVVNTECHAPVGKYSPHAKFSLTVEAILDMTGGHWSEEEDLMTWIAANPYVRRVVLDQKDRSMPSVTLEDLEDDKIPG